MSVRSHPELKREIAAMERDLLAERENNKILEEKLKSLQRGADVKSRSSAQLMQDVEKLKVEKRTMRDWLERGVAEAERVSVQLVHLAEEVRQTDERVNEVDREVHDMGDRCSDTRRLIHETNSKTLELQHQIAEKESIEAAQTDPNRAQNLALLEEIAVLQKRVEEMRGAATMTKAAENAVGCLAACSRRTHRQLEKMIAAVNSGSAWEMEGQSMNSNNESFDSEDGDDDTRHPPIVLAALKAIVDRCDACLCTIWSGLSRFAFDQAHQRRQKDVEFQEAYMIVERDLDNTIADSSSHLRQLREELAMWRRKCENIKTRVLSNTTYGSNENANGAKNILDSASVGVYGEISGSFAALTREKNRVLIEETSDLEKTNDSLRKKLETIENDYKAVKELKHAYRDLELRKAELTLINEQVRKNNRLMKLRMWESGPVMEMGVPGR